jgi:hypothetical protein
LDIETKALVQRWILTFCEAPVLIDAELMRRVLDDADAVAEDRSSLTHASRLPAGG